jgi:hypothetical protein
LHVVTDDTFEAMAARAGKREHSLLLAISTPPKVADDGVMRRLVDHGPARTDPSFYFREFAAPDGCEVDEAAWEVAKPALDDFLHRDALRRPCRRSCARTPFAATGSASGCSWTARGHPMAPRSCSASTGHSWATAPPCSP